MSNIKKILMVTLLLCLAIAATVGLSSCTPEEAPHVHAFAETVEKAATCTDEGVMRYTCECEYTYTEVIEAKGHTKVVQQAVPATCTEGGLTEGSYCSECKLVFEHQVKTNATGHNPGVDANDTTSCVPATICLNGCGAVYVSAVSHFTLQDATCTEDAICSICKKVAVPAFGHTEDILAAKDPGCFTTGLTEGKYCTVCHTVTVPQEVIPVTNHDITESTVTAPTCTEQGYTTYSCQCGYDTYDADYVDANGHDHEAVVTPPTCVDEGYTTHTCHCGDNYTDNFVPESGHKDENNDHLCDVCTVKVSDCSAADAVKENIVDPTSDAAGSYDIVVKCSVCGEELSRTPTVLPSFNGTDYTVEYSFNNKTEDIKVGFIKATYTFKNDNSFTYTKEYDNFIEIETNYYVHDTIDAFSLDGVTLTYVIDGENAYYSFATNKVVNLTTLLAYGPAPVVITGDVVLTKNTALNNNGGLFIGTESTVGNLTINQTADADALMNYNTYAHVNIVNGTITVNGNEQTAASDNGKSPIYGFTWVTKLTIGPKGSLVINNYNYGIRGNFTVNIQNDLSVKEIYCDSLTITDGAVINAGHVETVRTYENSSKGTSEEFGYNHAIKILDGTLNVTGTIKSTGIKVGSLLNGGTKGYLNATHGNNAILRADKQGARYDFVNGAATFTQTTGVQQKSLIMIDQDVEVNINMMKDCVFTANNYEYVFYSKNAKNTTKTLSYCDGSLVVNDCKYVCRSEVNIVRTADDKTLTPTAAKLEVVDNRVYYVVTCTSDYATAEEFMANLKIQIRVNNGADAIYLTEENAVITSFDAATDVATFRVDVTDLEVVTNAYYVRLGEKDAIAKDGVTDFNGIEAENVSSNYVAVNGKVYLLMYDVARGMARNGYGTVALKVIDDEPTMEVFDYNLVEENGKAILKISFICYNFDESTAIFFGNDKVPLDYTYVRNGAQVLYSIDVTDKNVSDNIYMHLSIEGKNWNCLNNIASDNGDLYSPDASDSSWVNRKTITVNGRNYVLGNQYKMIVIGK